MTTLKRIVAGTAVAVAASGVFLGVGTSVASAAPGVGPGMFSQDHGWGGDDWDDHGHGHGRWGRGDWNGPGWNGPAPGVYFNPPCATGPLGFVTICA